MNILSKTTLRTSKFSNRVGVFAAILAVAICSVGESSYASGLVLPPVICSTVAQGNSSTNCATMVTGVTLAPGVSGPASSAVSAADLTLGPDPYLSAATTITVQNGPPPRAEASAEAVVYFELVGPPGQDVPLLVDAKASVANSYPGEAYSVLTIGVPLANQPLLELLDSTQCCTKAPYLFPFPFDGDISLAPNQEEELFLLVTTAPTFSFGSETGASASASLDPIISIDPSFAEASEYSLVFSPGFPSASSIPEPGYCLLIGSALLGAGLARSRIARSERYAVQSNQSADVEPLK